MKKRYLSLVLATTLVIGLLSACAGKKEGSSASKKTEKTTYETVSTEDLESALKSEDTIVLDARSQDSYSGWALHGDKRGGHIPGSNLFSAFWLTCDYDDKKNLEGLTREKVLKEALETKGITDDKKVIVYDTNGKDAKAVCDYLAKQGIKNLSTYDAKQWIDDDSKEMESYPGYDMYVPASIVNEIVSGKSPEGFPSKDKIVVLDVRWGDDKESGYLDGHVPASVHINTDSFEPPKKYGNDVEVWLLADNDTLKDLLLKNGITKDSFVIVTSPEPMAACRMAVICKYMGVSDVRVMSGGLVTWNGEGYKLEKKANKPKAATDFGTDVPAAPEWITTIDQAKENLQKPNCTLVDNRTWDEYIGKTSGYDYYDVAGRIEGAVFGHAGIKSSSSVYYYRNIDKTMRTSSEIFKLFEKDGIDPHKHLMFMCGSGWRAAEILWDARVLGLSDTSLYSDGWIGWSNAGNPYVTGDPTK